MWPRRSSSRPTSTCRPIRGTSASSTSPPSIRAHGSSARRPAPPRAPSNRATRGAPSPPTAHPPRSTVAAVAGKRLDPKPPHDLLVEPGSAPALETRDPGVRVCAAGKQEGLVRLDEVVERIGVLHDRLFAEATRAVLLVLQGMDASGKDGTIRKVFTGLNPQGCRVVSFKVPVGAELAHDYLWRVHAACPARGEIAIFNRSHYEEVVAARVRKIVPAEVWMRRD